MKKPPPITAAAPLLRLRANWNSDLFEDLYSQINNCKMAPLLRARRLLHSSHCRHYWSSSGDVRKPSLISRDQVHEMLKAVPFGGMQDRVRVDDIRFGRVVLRLNVRGDSSMTRPGGTVSGPALFALSDLAMWALVCTTRGPSPLSVTTNATIDFFRKPEPERDLIAAAEVLKDGKATIASLLALKRSAWSVPNPQPQY